MFRTSARKLFLQNYKIRARAPFLVTHDIRLVFTKHGYIQYTGATTADQQSIGSYTIGYRCNLSSLYLIEQ